jgi:Holliday junction DNA helicase RuvB
LRFDCWTGTRNKLNSGKKATLGKLFRLSFYQPGAYDSNSPHHGFSCGAAVRCRTGERGLSIQTPNCALSHFVLPSGTVASVKNNPAPDPNRERLVSAAPVGDDSSFELKLRPQRLAEFIGQKKVKENLAVAIEAARSRGEAMDHVLLYGPPGLGKTTLANIIANELGVHFQPTAAPLLQIKGDLTAIITNLQDKQVLFVDEIHRLQPVLEELLYSALEDYKLDIIIGQGPSARTHTLEVKPFTFIGATTRAGLISSPLRARFGIVLRLEFYTPEDLQIIVERSAEILGVAIDDAGAREIASRSRGTPRIANRLLRRVRDYAQVRAGGRIDEATAKASLQMLEVDQYGFDEVDRRLLLTIIEKYQGGPVGVNTLAAVLAEEPDAIEEIYEPFLMQIGFLNRTPRGRVATQLAYEHFKITPPRRQASLF